MRLSFCPAVAFSSISRILVCSTGELGGDKHGGCLIEKSAPKKRDISFHNHILTQLVPWINRFARLILWFHLQMPHIASKCLNFNEFPIKHVEWSASIAI